MKNKLGTRQMFVPPGAPGSANSRVLQSSPAPTGVCQANTIRVARQAKTPAPVPHLWFCSLVHCTESQIICPIVTLKVL